MFQRQTFSYEQDVNVKSRYLLLRWLGQRRRRGRRRWRWRLRQQASRLIRVVITSFTPSPARPRQPRHWTVSHRPPLTLPAITVPNSQLSSTMLDLPFNHTGRYLGDGLRVQPPPKENVKNLRTVPGTKHMQCDMRCQKKPSGFYKMQENAWRTAPSRRTLLTL